MAIKNTGQDSVMEDGSCEDDALFLKTVWQIKFKGIIKIKPLSNKNKVFSKNWIPNPGHFWHYRNGSKGVNLHIQMNARQL